MRLLMVESNTFCAMRQNTVEEVWEAMRELQNNQASPADLHTAFECIAAPFKGHKQPLTHHFIDCLVHPGIRAHIDAMFKKGLLQGVNDLRLFRTLGSKRDQAWVCTVHPSHASVQATPADAFLAGLDCSSSAAPCPMSTKKPGDVQTTYHGRICQLCQRTCATICRCQN